MHSTRTGMMQTSNSRSVFDQDWMNVEMTSARRKVLIIPALLGLLVFAFELSQPLLRHGGLGVFQVFPLDENLDVDVIGYQSEAVGEIDFNVVRITTKENCIALIPPEAESINEESEVSETNETKASTHVNVEANTVDAATGADGEDYAAINLTKSPKQLFDECMDLFEAIDGVALTELKSVDVQPEGVTTQTIKSLEKGFDLEKIRRASRIHVPLWTTVVILTMIGIVTVLMGTFSKTEKIHIYLLGGGSLALCLSAIGYVILTILLSSFRGMWPYLTEVVNEHHFIVFKYSPLPPQWYHYAELVFLLLLTALTCYGVYNIVWNERSNRIQPQNSTDRQSSLLAQEDPAENQQDHEEETALLSSPEHI